MMRAATNVRYSQKLKSLLNAPAIFFILAGLYPVCFLASKNWFVYESRQLLFLLVVPCVTGLVGILVAAAIWLVGFAGRAILDRLPETHRQSAAAHLDFKGTGRIILCSFGFVLLYVLLESSITRSNTIILGFVACAVVACLLTRKKKFGFVNVVLLLMTALAAGELLYSMSTKSVRTDYLIRQLNRERDNTVRFTSTPNIYLIHLESYHSPAAMKRLYGFDNEKFGNELRNMGFFVSQNNFANYCNTLSSIGSMFLQQHHYYSLESGIEDAVGIRDLIGGGLYNPTLSILKNNGYKLVYLHSDTYDFMGSDYLDYYYPPNRLHDSLLVFQSARIDEVRSKLFGTKQPNRRYTEGTDMTEFHRILWSKLEAWKTNAEPYFCYIKDVGVTHSPSDGTYSWRNSEEGQVDRYKDLVKKANPRILEMVGRIVESDRAGVIILYGDHGAWRYRRIWDDGKKKDINELLHERRKIDGVDMALDMFGVFVAVRYPNGNPQLLDGETHVNMFRKLFSELSNGDILLREKPANESYLKLDGRCYVLVKDGVAQERIEVADVSK